jgi:hypothetical protein
VAGGTLTDTEIKDIHADAVDMTRGEAMQISKEIRDKMRIRNSHRAMADDHRNVKATKDRPAKYKNPSLTRLDRQILEDTKGDDRLGVATVLANQASSRGEWYELIKQYYPDLTGKERDDLFKQAWEARGKAKYELQKRRAEVRQEQKITEREYELQKNVARIARAKARKQRATLERQYRDLTRTTKEKALGVALDAVGLPKTLMATGEFSYILRQGYLPLLLFTRAAGKGLLGVVKGLQSDAIRLVYEERLREHPKFDESQLYGTEYGQIGDLNIQDEHFVTRVFEGMAHNDIAKAGKIQLTEKAAIPTPGVVGKVLGRAGRIVGGAQTRLEHAYVLPGDAQRLLTYANLAAIVDGQALTKQQVDEAKRFAAKIANRFSGRGDLRGIFNPAGAIGRFLNAIGFSPRLVAARFQSGWWLSPVSLPFVPKGIRMTMLKKQLRFNALIFAVLAPLFALLAPDKDEDESPWAVFDPSSKKFMKGRIRGTDYHVDFTSNMSEPMALALADWVASGYFAATGQWNRMKDVWHNEWERYVVTDRGEPFRYFRGKLGPVAGFGVDAATGKDYLGRKFDAGVEFRRMLWPLAYQNAYNGLTYDPYEQIMKPGMKDQADARWDRFKNGPHDWGSMLAVLATEAVGLNVQQYAQSDQTRAEEKAWEMFQKSDNSKLSEDERAVQAGVRRLYRLKDEMQNHGGDTAAVDKAIATYASKYYLTPATLTKLEKQATGPKFDFVTKQMTPDQLQVLIDEYATPKEKPELQKILESKVASQDDKQKKQARDDEFDALKADVRSGRVPEAELEKKLTAQLESGEISEQQYKQKLESVYVSDAATKVQNADASSDADFRNLETLITQAKPADRQEVYQMLLKKVDGKLKNKDVKSSNEADRLMQLVKRHFPDLEK